MESEIRMRTFKHCDRIDFHEPHDVAYFEEEDEEDFSCPGIVTVADRVAALERRSEEFAGMRDELYRANDSIHKLQQQVEYHRRRHGEVEQKLQMETTSPDTKEAHELGYKNGFAAGLAQTRDVPHLERAIDLALMPALQHCARLENEVQRANQALNTAYQKIDAIFNPPAPEPDAVAEDEPELLSEHVAGLPKIGVAGGEFPPETGRADV